MRHAASIPLGIDPSTNHMASKQRAAAHAHDCDRRHARLNAPKHARARVAPPPPRSAPRERKRKMRRATPATQLSSLLPVLRRHLQHQLRLVLSPPAAAPMRMQRRAQIRRSAPLNGQSIDPHVLTRALTCVSVELISDQPRVCLCVTQDALSLKSTSTTCLGRRPLQKERHEQAKVRPTTRLTRLTSLVVT